MISTQAFSDCGAKHNGVLTWAGTQHMSLERVLAAPHCGLVFCRRIPALVWWPRFPGGRIGVRGIGLAGDTLGGR